VDVCTENPALTTVKVSNVDNNYVYYQGVWIPLNSSVEITDTHVTVNGMIYTREEYVQKTDYLN
jgi:hypothetical protein